MPPRGCSLSSTWRSRNCRRRCSTAWGCGSCSAHRSPASGGERVKSRCASPRGAGVAGNEKGDILVNDGFETSAPGIYAAGDVIGPPRLASVSMEQARVAVCHAFGIQFKDRVDTLAPHCIYSIPEVAMVGMTEDQAKAAGVEYEIGRGLFSANTQARISGFQDGMIKLVFRRADRVLLGGRILCGMGGGG